MQRRGKSENPVGCAALARTACFSPIFRELNLLVGDYAGSYPLPVPIYYECQRCTACCRWPGQVRLTEAEISAMASFLGVSEQAFIEEYTRLRSDRRGLALMDKPNSECIFLEGNDCRVQSAKPKQCRDFPNLWNFPGFEKVCQAKHVALDAEEYQRRTGVTAPTPPIAGHA